MFQIGVKQPISYPDLGELSTSKGLPETYIEILKRSCFQSITAYPPQTYLMFFRYISAFFYHL